MRSTSSRTLEGLPPPPPGRTGWPWTAADPEPEDPGRPFISIVTPSYNQGGTIEETIRSVLLQDYPNLEYIIMDGGSDDDSVDIIRRYEPWLSHWVSQRDRGQSHAVNLGWRLARGRYLGWLNSDDLYLPGALARVMEEFEADPTLAVIGGECLYVDESGTTIAVKAARSWDPEDMLVNAKPAQVSTFYHRRFLDEVGGLDESLHFAMDRDFQLRLGDRYFPDEARTIPVPLAALRIWERTKTAIGGRAAVRDRLRLVDRFLAHSTREFRTPRLRARARAKIYQREAARCVSAGRRLSGLLYRVLAAANSRRLRDLRRRPGSPAVT